VIDQDIEKAETAFDSKSEAVSLCLQVA